MFVLLVVDQAETEITAVEEVLDSTLLDQQHVLQVQLQ